MNTFLEMIGEASTIAIVGHTSPDGDCVGSCLGLYNYIIEHFPKAGVQVYLEEFSSDFMFLHGAELVSHDDSQDVRYELCISLDCGDTLRHGGFGRYFQTAQKTICIDHHVSNKGFGDFCKVDLEASSTAEAVYKFLDDKNLSRNCAEALYMGIVHDTGVFKHSCTSKRTMEIAGALLSCGARSDYVIDHTFYNKTFVQNKLLGRALENAVLYLDGRVIVSLLTLEDFKSCSAQKLDTDGIVDQLRITEGVEAAVFVYQQEDNVYKYSLRSNGAVNVSDIACSLGGGGHIRAAGVQVEAAYKETLDTILKEMETQLRKG